MKPANISVLLVACGIASAAPPATQRNFVACPILQDTETVPCWLADYEGQRYYLGIQIDMSAEFHPPYLGHKALIEGTVTDEEICGGKVLKPVKVSVLPELDPSCNTMLPAVDAYKVPFAPRGPGPREKIELLRARGHRPQLPPPSEPETLTPPYQVREFVVHFNFDSEFANRDVRKLTEALNYVDETRPKSIEIITHRAASALSDGRMLEEKPFIARRRAQRLAEIFVESGVPEAALKLRIDSAVVAGDGIEDWKDRHARIIVRP